MMFSIDGMIDADELLRGMDALRCPISEQEATEMINFADHDKGSLAFGDTSPVFLRSRFVAFLRRISHCFHSDLGDHSLLNDYA